MGYLQTCKDRRGVEGFKKYQPIFSSNSIKSFSDYKAAKGKQWFSKTKGGKAKGTKNSAADQVPIYIGSFVWKEKENILKPKRRKVALRISNSVKSPLVCQKAEEKWKAY